LADDLSKRFPQDTIVQSQDLPMIRAAIALRANAAPKAVEEFAASERYELGNGLEPAYLRGEAYLAARRGTAAAAEFQKILDHPGVVQGDPIGVLAHLGLRRAYSLAGDNAKAKNALPRFLRAMEKC
jgi:uncharacterized protein YfaS (alpha-2-macroglobulin family)